MVGGLMSGNIHGTPFLNSVDDTPITEDEVVAAAEEVETQRRIVSWHGTMNQPIDIREKVRADGKLRIEQDKLTVMERKYEAIFERWVRGGCK